MYYFPGWGGCSHSHSAVNRRRALIFGAPVPDGTVRVRCPFWPPRRTRMGAAGPKRSGAAYVLVCTGMYLPVLVRTVVRIETLSACTRRAQADGDRPGPHGHGQRCGSLRADSDSESPVPETQMSLGLDSGRRVARSGLSSAQAQPGWGSNCQCDGLRVGGLSLTPTRTPWPAPEANAAAWRWPTESTGLGGTPPLESHWRRKPNGVRAMISLSERWFKWPGHPLSDIYVNSKKGIMIGLCLCHCVLVVLKKKLLSTK